MTQSVNESVNDGGDCRTAPATPGLLNTRHIHSKWRDDINLNKLSKSTECANKLNN